jgi:hypothetical protein
MSAMTANGSDQLRARSPSSHACPRETASLGTPSARQTADDRTNRLTTDADCDMKRFEIVRLFWQQSLADVIGLR